ncbi:hypothetical protein Tco_1531515 [Tanacetum coccineum]
MGGSYYSFPCSILSTEKDRKTPQRYPDVPTTSWRISFRSRDSFQGLTPKSPSSWHRPLAPNTNFYDHNDPRDFAKLIKAIALPQDVLSTSDRRLIELENQVQCLMEAHLAPMQPTQVNKITTSSGGKWYTFKPEQNNFGDTYNPSWKSHPNLWWRQPQNSQNNFSKPPHRFQPNGSIPNRSFNNRHQSFNNQSNLEGLVYNFMASQDTRVSKFEADFKQQQNEMTKKIDTVLKAITDRIPRALPSDTVKNPKLSTSPVLSTRSFPTKDLDMPQPEAIDPTAIDESGPSQGDEEIEWLDVEDPLNLVDTSEESVYESLIREMPKCSLSYEFRIKKGDP